MAFVGVLIAAGFAVVGARAVQLQVLQSQRLGSMARDQYVREVEWRPRRGSITDRNGVLLAQDVEADSAFADPQELPERGRRAALARLARVLSIDERALSRRLDRGGRFAWVKRRLSPDESAAVRALAVPGIHFAKESRRYYPRRELAAQVLGYVGDDGDGLEGVERLYDDALSGESLRVPSLRDARGVMLLRDAPERPLEGARVELTLDQGLQLAAERALGRAVSQSRAADGMLVAMDPRSGEVLALATAPAFNPNAPRRGDTMRNRAVLDTFEPGSTFKIFTLAGALDSGALRASDPINCESGELRIGTHVIHDHKALGWTGPARIMAASSNIGAAKIGQRLGRERLQRTLQAFGFGEKAGTGLPGEPRGQVPYPRAEVSLATMSFGQGVTASALQVTAAVAAIANGGVLLRPRIVRRVVDPVQGPLLEVAPEVVRRAASAATAGQIRRWMEGVIADADGTGKRARLDGWRAGGKTGTAQKADPVSGGYSSDKRMSSFVGFAPAEDPRIAVGVFVDEPRGEVYGGEVAAPVFKEVVEYALRSMGVPPSGALAAARGPTATRTATATPTPTPTPAATAMSTATPTPTATETGSDDEGEPPSVEEAIRTARQGEGGVAVPLLAGLPARSALKVLEAVELLGETAGTGVVAAQAPAPGTVVERGSRIRLVLKPRG
jgi:cell division protein FtsI (penicillin-binding protein 3)